MKVFICQAGLFVHVLKDSFITLTALKIGMWGEEDNLGGLKKFHWSDTKTSDYVVFSFQTT